MIRPRELDLEWADRARRASSRNIALTLIGVNYVLALAVGGLWAMVFGTFLIVTVLLMAKQLWEEHRTHDRQPDL